MVLEESQECAHKESEALTLPADEFRSRSNVMSAEIGLDRARIGPSDQETKGEYSVSANNAPVEFSMWILSFSMYSSNIVLHF